MKRTIFLLLCLLPLLLSAQTSWVKWWPQPNADSVWPNNIIKTYDGGYAFHWTHNEFFPAFDEVSHLYKTDSLGNLQWEQQWGWYGHTYNTLNQMPDSSYLWGGPDIVHITKNGQIDWIIDLDTLIVNGAKILLSAPTPDGNIVFVAFKLDGTIYTENDWWFLKIDGNGNLIWIKPYRYAYKPDQLRLFSNGNFIILSDHGSDQFLLAKFNEQGGEYWSSLINYPNLGTFGMIVDSQDNLLLHGYADSLQDNDVIYADSLGNILWDRHLQLPDTNLTPGFLLNAVETNDSGFVLSSVENLSNQINGIIKINHSGNVKWWSTLPGIPAFEKPNENLVRDDGFLIGIFKVINGDENIGIAKTDSIGLITNINQDKNPITPKLTLYQNYPNPFNAETTISFQTHHAAKIEISIFNILGEKLEVIANERLPAGYHHFKWVSNQYSSGVYFYQLKINNKQSITNKMMLVK